MLWVFTVDTLQKLLYVCSVCNVVVSGGISQKIFAKTYNLHSCILSAAQIWN